MKEEFNDKDFEIIDKVLIFRDGVKRIESADFYRLDFTSAVIPDSVTCIGKKAFAGCNGLVNVTIPDSVIMIDDDAFSETGLISVNIPSSVTSIGKHAFCDCKRLTSVVIPPSVSVIGSSAFGCCYSLTCVDISNLSAWCRIEFNDCCSNPLLHGGHLYLNGKELSELVIPDEITRIGDWAFYGFHALTSVIIPNSVTKIGRSAFRRCNSLTSIVIPDSITEIGEDAFYYCESLASVNIPTSVTKIGNRVFSGCKSLTSIVIPDSITEIGENAFAYCESLTSIILPDSVVVIAEEAFCCTAIKTITIPKNIKEIGIHAFSGDYFQSIEVNPENENFLSEDGVLFSKDKTEILLFPCAKDIEHYDIPNGVKTIGRGAFSFCELESIHIPDSVTRIKEYAFEGLEKNMIIDIPNSVTLIEDYAFYNSFWKYALVVFHQGMQAHFSEYAFLHGAEIVAPKEDYRSLDYMMRWGGKGPEFDEWFSSVYCLTDDRLPERIRKRITQNEERKIHTDKAVSQEPDKRN